MKGLWPWLLMALALLCAGAGASEPVFLFSYQQKPPYVVDEARGEGLYFDLARLLSQRLPEHEFVVRQIPRKRLDYLLAKDELPGLVLGVSAVVCRCPAPSLESALHRGCQPLAVPTQRSG